MGPRTLDERGLLCPQPIVDLARAMGGMAVGEELIVLSDDVAFPLDLRAWCAGTGHELLGVDTEGHDHTARVRKRHQR
jgi:cysteine desulfurase